MRFLLYPLCLLFVFYSTQATAQVAAKKLKQTLELKMQKTADDDMSGTRGASVVWHPVLKKYYAGFAGNTAYPLAVFDEKGKRLNEEDLATMIDLRGLWYNPVTKQICGNGYDDMGWFNYDLDKNGIPTDVANITDDMRQPSAQAVGTYNFTEKQVLFLGGSQVYKYNNQGVAVDSVVIHWGRKKTDGPGEEEDPTLSHEDYNATSLIYTGIKGQELGFLNVAENQIELYDIKTGYLIKLLTLPETATAELSFNFAYANGTYWIFNMDERKWVGYK
ncbi:MAG: hypothetical protein KA821_00415 [Chitinophagaceae bacterium]|nr:hypothetical protein [Chitinophagaceae bacterium]